MKYILTCLIIGVQIMVFGQDTVFFHVNPEMSYPYEEHSKNAMSSKIWYVNGIEVPYQKGVYAVPTNGHNRLDTIEIKTTVESTEYYLKTHRRKAKPVTTIDTVSQKMVTQLRQAHNYSLSQIYPGDFSIFSLDTFNIEQHLQVNISGYNREDTLFLHYNYSEPIKVFGDTTIRLNGPNKEMRNNLLARLELDNRELSPGCGQTSNQNYHLIYRLDYLFLHGEELRVNINLETNDVKLEPNTVAKKLR